MERRRGWLVAAGVLGACVAGASAQALRETSVYEVVDAAAPIAVPGQCSCIATPFSVPYRPHPGYGSGPAASLDGTPVFSPADRRRVVQERATLEGRAADGIAGNPHASLGVAMQLGSESAMANEDPRTEEETVRWLHLAAVQGHDDALRLLAYRYARGRGVRQDDGAAAYWFHQGVTRGDPISMTALGLLYAAGRGVAQEWPAAVRLWQRAQARAPLAARFLGDAYACGLGVPLDQARAVAAYKDAAARGESSSTTQLGHMYAGGCAEGTDEDAVKAFERAAQEGYPEAQVALSDLIRQGRGTDPNPLRAYFWARVAELRLPAGSLKTQATARAGAAARLLSPNELEAEEAMVRQMIADGARPLR